MSSWKVTRSASTTTWPYTTVPTRRRRCSLDSVGRTSLPVTHSLLTFHIYLIFFFIYYVFSFHFYSLFLSFSYIAFLFLNMLPCLVISNLYCILFLDIESTTQFMYLKFYSDYSVQKAGFLATFHKGFFF